MKDKESITARVDAALKREAEAILKKLGLDFTTAIRMFLKRIIIARGIPFDMHLPEEQELEIEEICSRSHVYMATAKEYLAILNTVPEGYVIRHRDILNHIADTHHVTKCDISEADLDKALSRANAPSWRIVSWHGFLQNVGQYCPIDSQKQRLIKEGIGIIPSETRGRLWKVDDLDSFLYDLSNGTSRKAARESRARNGQ